MKTTGLLAMALLGMAMTGSVTAQTPATTDRTASPSGRITAPPVAEMSPEQREEYERSLKTFGGPFGPRLPLINSPEVAKAWSQMQNALTQSALPRKLREVAILSVASVWKSEFEWYVHAADARKFGVSPDAIEAIRTGKEPRFTSAEEGVVYRYATELQTSRHVSDATYSAAWKLLGTKTLVDLTVLLGHYTSVSMTLNAHLAPLPDGVAKAF